MDLTPESIELLAAAAGLHAVPKLIQAWKMRTDAVSRLILETAAEVSRLRRHQVSADRRTAALIESLGEANERISTLEQERERTSNEMEGIRGQLALWISRAKRAAGDLHELYRCISSSEQGMSLPPPPKREPWEE